MSHPDASVRSICSGKTNFNTGEDLESYGYPSNGYSNENISVGGQDMDDMSSRLSQGSNYSVNSKNLKALGNLLPNNRESHRLYNLNSYTNISIASSGSDYQQNYMSPLGNSPIMGPSSPDSGPETNPSLIPFDSNSRLLSRNSTTSCLSTTATKDGIEGKKLHRHGPTHYSSNIIANMIQNANHGQQSGKLNSPGMDPFNIPLRSLPNSSTLRSSAANSPVPYHDRDTNVASQTSLKSTNAEVDGESGGKKTIDIESYSNAMPPVSLDEKINLLNTDRVNGSLD